jgi:hypothetical protein
LPLNISLHEEWEKKISPSPEVRQAKLNLAIETNEYML